MNSATVSPLDTRSPTAEVSLLRLYTLRLCYFILAAGLGIYVWPSVLAHSTDVAAVSGVRLALLAGLGATALLGFRHPLRMLPLLIFELTWKAIYLLAFALPAWRAHQLTAAMAEDVRSVAMVVIFLPLIPWGYVWRHYVLAAETAGARAV